MILIDHNIVTCIMQGDQYSLPFRISCRGQPMTSEELAGVEITIGTLCKATPDVAFKSETGMWEMPLTQAETFALAAEPVPTQIRLLFPDGSVVGDRFGPVTVVPSLSHKVLNASQEPTEQEQEEP